MGTKNYQNGGPNPPKSSPEGAKRGPGRPENRKKRQTQHKPPTARSRLPCFERKSGQHDSKLASKIEEKSMQQSIEKSMHLGIDFWKDFD